MSIELISAVADVAAEIVTVVPQAIPDPEPQAPAGLSDGMARILGAAKWIGLVIVALGLIGQIAGWAWASRRGDGQEHVQGLAWSMGAAMGIGAAISVVGWIAG
ncbi:hypothetical protein [Myceligenerans crystallogenes]|uniref:TrbC/VIRB2 family protein n=1 Tax=Myceligenerans crystallogenes TaxID=316335 RepID=A0ABN2NE45_9MICO